MPMLDGMDEGGVDEVDPVDVVEGAHLCSKDHDTAKPPESSTMLESREMVVFGECDYPESSFNVFAEFLEDKNVNRSGSTAEPTEQPCASPRYMDDADNMVEELMVRDYDSSNLAIVGTSKNRERIQTKLSHWPNISRLKGGSGSGSSYSNNLYPDNGKQTASNARYSSFPDVLDNKTSSDDCNEVVGQLKSTGHNQDSNMSSRGGIQTKIMSKSGFSEFFIKSTLKGKGIVFRGPRLDGVRLESRGTNNVKDAASNIKGSSPLWGLSADTAMPSSFGLARPRAGGSVHEGVSLREWLKTGRHKINKVECLHIFRQIVDVVDYSHSQGTPLRDLCPSCFKLSQMNQVKYLGRAVQRDMLEDTKVHSIPFPGDHVRRRQPVEQGMFPYSGTYLKKQKFGINMSSARWWPQFTPNYVVESETGNYGDVNFVDAQEFCINQHNQSAEFGTRRNLSSHHLANAAQHQLTSISDQLEEKWYMSPEEQNDDICTVSSNIYSLGVLLFELLGRFDSERAHATAMLELRQRILPPHFLSENPKEAGFCLWLLHPEPSSRPTTRYFTCFTI
uniref:Protein SPA1-RELATED 2 isoform X2 n=1 Tax=Rhizophora mucronata TaxID=61149 RepID=A0A2P2JG78_RHIMU